jgi:hypothetical protein
MNAQELRVAIEQQTAKLRRYGVKADLPESYVLLQQAELHLHKNKCDTNQCLWRMAAIAHLAMLCVEGRWREALAFSHDPSIVGEESSRFPTPTTSDAKKLAALMYNNMVACHLLAKRLSNHTDWLATEGLKYLQELQNPLLNRWKAVLWVARARLSTDVLEHDRYATQAHRFARHPILVPELYAYIQGMARGGDGTFKPGLLQRRRAATLQPNECLYLFND